MRTEVPYSLCNRNVTETKGTIEMFAKLILSNEAGIKNRIVILDLDEDAMTRGTNPCKVDKCRKAIVCWVNTNWSGCSVMASVVERSWQAWLQLQRQQETMKQIELIVLIMLTGGERKCW